MVKLVGKFTKEQQEYIAVFQASHLANKPDIQPHEEDFIQQQIETAVGLGMSDSEVEAFVLSRLRCLRRDNYTADRAATAELTKLRSKGGSGRKKLAEPDHEEWLKQELKNHRGKKCIYEKISQSLRNKYGYKVGARTVRDRCKELGLLESA